MTAAPAIDPDVSDPAIHCTRCEAVCCRLTVLLMAGDKVPSRFVALDAHGVEVMAKTEDGWCAAIDPRRMCCGIYEQRPAVCREFAMGGGGCREERAAWYSKSSVRRS